MSLLPDILMTGALLFLLVRFADKRRWYRKKERALIDALQSFHDEEIIHRKGSDPS